MFTGKPMGGIIVYVTEQHRNQTATQHSLKGMEDPKILPYA
jgi:hypothetical protein